MMYVMGSCPYGIMLTHMLSMLIQIWLKPWQDSAIQTKWCSQTLQQNGVVTVSHVKSFVCTCFWILRLIHSIWRLVPPQFYHVETGLLQRCIHRSATLDWLQSVTNTAAWLTVGLQWYDHITLLLTELHRLQIPQCIQYKSCVMCTGTRMCTQACTDIPENAICPVVSTEPWHRLHSAFSADLVMTAACCLTLGDCAFADAGLWAWNGLSDAIHQISSLATFKWSLKTHPFNTIFTSMTFRDHISVTFVTLIIDSYVLCYITFTMGVSGWMFLLVPAHRVVPDKIHRTVKQLCVVCACYIHYYSTDTLAMVDSKL